LNGDENKLLEAESLLESWEEINPDEVYNLACGYAQLDKFKLCHEKLIHCKEGGTLPGVEHLLTDEDLDPARELDWLKRLLTKIS
jgi:hypothetical protein